MSYFDLGGKTMQPSHPYTSDHLASNPYAAPQAIPANPQPQAGGIWSDGKLVVMHKQATLPDVCIKSNEQTDGFRLKRKLSWHHPAVFAAILINLIVYAVLAMVLSKRATIQIGLSDYWRRKRVRRIIIAWSSVFLGIAVFIGGLILIDGRGGADFAPFGIVGGIFLILFGAFYGLFGARMIAPTKIDDNYVYIKGAHPDFIARFSAAR